MRVLQSEMEPQLVPQPMRDSHIVHNRRKHIGNYPAFGGIPKLREWFKLTHDCFTRITIKK